MTNRTKSRVQEANILRREKRKITETRKETEKLKAYATGSMM